VNEFRRRERETMINVIMNAILQLAAAAKFQKNKVPFWISVPNTCNEINCRTRE